ncbi:Phosphatidylglycerol/phosphatidylinositol transfer protein [Clonorchis sinensis]|uniref:Niemann-Pick C2 protein n=2 Tax=Clonorchis sinensis TaxID=79923 RepID=G7YUB5_CLOSI|nr:Phosphatidylglycerol/phosphatidylinositol transfer protein [Clonorchis sinensis]GAA56545.1 Niemann-Pick C2 protein [Clonorchis sinensis]
MLVYNLLVCGLILCEIGISEAIRFSDCGSVNVVVRSVDVSPCKSDPCTLHGKEVVTVRIGFKALADIDAGEGRIRGTLGGEYVVIPLPQTDVCGHLSPPCPVRAQKIYTYKYTGVVPSGIRPGTVIIQWQLLTKGGAVFLCAEFPVIIGQAA